MPKKKQFFINLPKLVLFDTLDNNMFGYIMGMKKAMPSLTLKRCMEMFMDDYNLSEDNYPLEQGLQTWYRMFNAYKEFRKT